MNKQYISWTVNQSYPFITQVRPGGTRTLSSQTKNQTTTFPSMDKKRLITGHENNYMSVYRQYSRLAVVHISINSPDAMPEEQRTLPSPHPA